MSKINSWVTTGYRYWWKRCCECQRLAVYGKLWDVYPGEITDEGIEDGEMDGCGLSSMFHMVCSQCLINLISDYAERKDDGKDSEKPDPI